MGARASGERPQLGETPVTLRTMTCGVCKGSGTDTYDGWNDFKCRNCGGKGTVMAHSESQLTRSQIFNLPPEHELDASTDDGWCCVVHNSDGSYTVELGILDEFGKVYHRGEETFDHPLTVIGALDASGYLKPDTEEAKHANV